MIPVSLRPYQHHGIAMHRQRIGVRRECLAHLGVIVIGELERRIARDLLVTKPGPEFLDALLRMTIEKVEALAPREVLDKLNQFVLQVGPAIWREHGQSLDLRKMPKVPDAGATRRLIAHKP